ncbi:MAG: hypothetical protein AB7S74_05270 [Hyphomicrobium sp.]
MRNALIRSKVLALALAAVALGSASTCVKAGDGDGVEEIYVLRSVRETRSKPTEACSTERTKLSQPAWEDQYTFRSLETRSKDGRILNTDAGKVGEIRACFGNSADPAVWELYGDLNVNGVSGKAFGKCYKTKADFPEKGVNLFACAFDLFDLSGGYLGGQLTTNSLTTPELFGTASNPTGYTQVSIATIRLWKKRAAP